MEYRHRSPEELELLAEHFLSEHGRRYFKNVETLIEEIVEDSGSTIWPVENLGPYSPGFLPIKGKKIYVDEYMQLTQPHDYRFTLAEEKAHQLIHAPIFECWETEKVRAYMSEMSKGEYVRFEREARYLAACILMPGRVFHEHLQRYTCIIIAQRTDRHRETEVLHSMLSRDFNVAMTAVARRCVEVRRLHKKRSTRLVMPNTFPSSL